MKQFIIKHPFFSFFIAIAISAPIGAGSVFVLYIILSEIYNVDSMSSMIFLICTSYSLMFSAHYISMLIFKASNPNKRLLKFLARSHFLGKKTSIFAMSFSISFGILYEIFTYIDSKVSHADTILITCISLSVGIGAALPTHYREKNTNDPLEKAINSARVNVYIFFIFSLILGFLAIDQARQAITTTEDGNPELKVIDANLQEAKKSASEAITNLESEIERTNRSHKAFEAEKSKYQYKPKNDDDETFPNIEKLAEILDDISKSNHDNNSKIQEHITSLKASLLQIKELIVLTAQKRVEINSSDQMNRVYIGSIVVRIGAITVILYIFGFCIREVRKNMKKISDLHLIQISMSSIGNINEEELARMRAALFIDDKEDKISKDTPELAFSNIMLSLVDRLSHRDRNNSSSSQ